MIKDSNRIAIITREQNVSFGELLQRINQFSEFTPRQSGERTLIFADNSAGWIYAFYSVWANHGIAVPVDASSTVSDVAYIIRDCKPTCVWTTHDKETVVNDAMKEAGHTATIYYIEDVEAKEPAGEKANITYQEEDTALIIYTSGTTGSPKGVMLSFRNILVNVRAVSEEVPIFTPDRRTLILLPLHHVLPLVGTVVMPLYVGGGVAICPSMSGSDIMDTLQRGQIAIMIGVPRLWQTLYGGIKKKIDASALTRGLFNLCAKVNNVSFSRFVFQAVHKKMGGHIRFFVSGGAALEREIALGLQTLGLELLEGYGMTEAAPMISFTRPGDLIPNCVGLPLSAEECKLVDGEICAKGPNIMQGYYNRPEETAAVIDKDGFLHTGDLGRFDEKGRIYITGRSKEIIVLSNGKNVQPNEIEYKLEQYADRVKEAAVVQDGDMLRAIIVPNEEWAKQLSDAEVEQVLKREVLEPYNLTVTNYKKLMNLLVYRNDLPRTKLEKLQRFKLKDILAAHQSADSETQTQQDKAVGTAESKPLHATDEPGFEEYQILKNYIEKEKNIVVHPTDHIETDLALDSLDRVALEGFIHQTFGVTVNADSMPGYNNIEALAKHIVANKTRMEVEVEDWHKFLHSNSSDLQLPRSSFTIPLVTNVFYGAFKVYNSLSIKGVENIPSEGPFIIAPNHQSFLDGPLVSVGLPKQILMNSYFYATEEHVQGSLRKAFARNNNIILMERNNLRNSILKLAEVLKQGKNVIIFPEGSRTRNGGLKAFKKTFAILGIEMNVPVVPVCIKGAFEALPRTRYFVTPHHIEVTYLPPVYPDGSLSYEEFAEKVKQAIQEKLSK